jgi:hypothetical protein
VGPGPGTGVGLGTGTSAGSGPGTRAGAGGAIPRGTVRMPAGVKPPPGARVLIRPPAAAEAISRTGMPGRAAPGPGTGAPGIPRTPGSPQEAISRARMPGIRALGTEALGMGMPAVGTSMAAGAGALGQRSLGTVTPGTRPPLPPHLNTQGVYTWPRSGHSSPAPSPGGSPRTSPQRHRPIPGARLASNPNPNPNGGIEIHSRQTLIP